MYSASLGFLEFLMKKGIYGDFFEVLVVKNIAKSIQIILEYSKMSMWS